MVTFLRNGTCLWQRGGHVIIISPRVPYRVRIQPIRKAMH